jgi:hypothetical protein
MVEPDFDRSTNDLSPMVAPTRPASEPVTRPAPEVSMMLASIRLPVVLVEQIDHLAARQGVRRSDVIREALTTYVLDQGALVAPETSNAAFGGDRALSLTPTRE